MDDNINYVLEQAKVVDFQVPDSKTYYVQIYLDLGSEAPMPI